MESLSFLWGLLLGGFCSFFDVWALSGTKTSVFKLMINPEYGASKIGNSWISRSVVACVITCQQHYTFCNSVAYNNLSGVCTPGYFIEYGAPPLSSTVGDSFYYSDYCNYQTGFQLFLSGNFIECLFIPKRGAYYDVARKICAEKNGRLMTANSTQRFDHFRLVVQYGTRFNTWIGLAKDENGEWMWENGERFDMNRITEIFLPDQPDNQGGFQNCASSRISDVNYLLDDSNCNSTLYYICETFIKHTSTGAEKALVLGRSAGRQ